MSGGTNFHVRHIRSNLHMRQMQKQDMLDSPTFVVLEPVLMYRTLNAEHACDGLSVLLYDKAKKLWRARVF